jgi:hypothetical protein
MWQVLNGRAQQIQANIEHLRNLQPALQQLAQGGTAVGTGINAHPRFAETFCRELSELTGQPFTPGRNFFALIGSQDAAVTLSGALKTTAVSLMKIANDLRCISGSLAGLAEIELEALPPGSSIMPGKANPVTPEAIEMVTAEVIGKDAAIAIAGQSGNYELDVMLPVIAHNLLGAIGDVGLPDSQGEAALRHSRTTTRVCSNSSVNTAPPLATTGCPASEVMRLRCRATSPLERGQDGASAGGKFGQPGQSLDAGKHTDPGAGRPGACPLPALPESQA